MKTPWIHTGIILLLLGTTALQAGVAIRRKRLLGWSQEQVIADLGKPKGKMQVGRKELWVYDRGDVEFDQGIVVVDTIVPLEIWQKQKEEQAQAEEAWRKTIAEQERIKKEREDRERRLREQEAARLPDATPTNSATFEMKDVPILDVDNGRRLGYGVNVQCTSEPSSSVKYYPVFKSSNPFFGSIRLGMSASDTNSGALYHFAFDETAANEFYVFYIDRDRDQSLNSGLKCGKLAYFSLPFSEWPLFRSN
jgi:hypothetical protein